MISIEENLRLLTLVVDCCCAWSTLQDICLEILVADKCGYTKSRKIVNNFKSILDQLYQHYAKNVEGSGGRGARVSNEDVNVNTSSKSVGSNKRAKAVLAIYHNFRASKNVMLCRTKIEQYCTEEVESPCETFDILMWWRVNKSGSCWDSTGCPYNSTYFCCFWVGV